jgi:hypothetical protein
MDVAKYVWQMNLQMEPYIEIGNNLVIIRQNKLSFLFISRTGAWIINKRNAGSILSSIIDCIHADTKVSLNIQNGENKLDLSIIGNWKYKSLDLVRILSDAHKPPNSHTIIQNTSPCVNDV